MTLIPLRATWARAAAALRIASVRPSSRRNANAPPPSTAAPPRPASEQPRRVILAVTVGHPSGRPGPCCTGTRVPGMRRAAALLMVVLTALLLAGAAIAWYADTTLVDDEEFATRVTSSLGDADVRRVVADQIVTGLTSSAVPNALVVRPLLVPLVSAVADSPVFRRVVHRALASRHRALVRGDTSFSFGLPISEGTLFEGIRRVAPTVARPHPRGPQRCPCCGWTRRGSSSRRPTCS